MEIINITNDMFVDNEYEYEVPEDTATLMIQPIGGDVKIVDDGKTWRIDDGSSDDS